MGPIGGHVRGAHPLGAAPPVIAVVRGDPHAPARNADDQTRSVARIHEDRVDPRVVVTAAEPLMPRRLIPQRSDQRPRVTRVVRAEQAARDRAVPDSARLGARFERPDHLQIPGDFDRAHGTPVRFAIRGALRVRGRRDLMPGGAAVAAAVNLDAEMAVPDRGISRSVAAVDERATDRKPLE